MNSIARFSLLAVLIFGLAGCSHDKPEVCPGSAALAELASMTNFRNGGPADPSNVLYTVGILHVKSACDIDENTRKVDMSIEIRFRATRTPDGESAEYSAPYFVAVTQGDRIISKKLYSEPFSFAPGEATTTFTASIDDIPIQVDSDKMAIAYQLTAGLQLTKAQLDYNRAMGRYGP